MGRIEEAVGRSAPFVKILPLPIISPRTPNVTDREFPKGQLWLDESVSPTIVWTHVGFGVWITSAGGGSGATTFPADAGVAVDLAGVLNVLGGSGIDTAGGGNTLTVSVSSSVASSFPADLGIGIPVAGALNILGAGGVTTSAAGNTITITGGGALNFSSDAGNAIPVANTITIAGGVGLTTTAAGSTVTFDLDVPVIVANGGTGQTTLTSGGIMLGNGIGPVTVTAQPINGQLLIGRTGLNPVLANLTSANASIVITNGSGTVDIVTGSAVANSFQTDTLVATPLGGLLILQSGLPLSTDTVNGVTVAQGPAANEIHVQFTNTIYGTGTTVGLGSVDLFTFNLGGAPKVFRFDVDIAGRDVVSGEGVGYKGLATAKTDGANAFIVEETYFDMDEDNNLLNSEIDLITVGNDVILRVDGGLIGATVNYVSRGTYVAV